jgi:hypothetical protein
MDQAADRDGGTVTEAETAEAARLPQLTSMSSSMRRYIGELVASLIEGAGLQPNTPPRPVVKQTRFAPPATCPVAATAVVARGVHEHKPPLGDGLGVVHDVVINARRIARPAMLRPFA